MEFYNNETNDSLKFKINAEGIDVNSIQPRLVFIANENINYIIFGEIENDVCTFDIPQLKIYENENAGKLRFELVAEDSYYNVWEDEFSVRTKKSIKVNEMFGQALKQVIPSINVSPIAPEVKQVPIKEEKKPEPVKVKKKEVKKDKPKKEVKKPAPVKEQKTIMKETSSKSIRNTEKTQIAKPVDGSKGFVSLSEFMRKS